MKRFFILAALLIAMPAQAEQFTAHLFGEFGYNNQTYVRTAEGGWHFDAGQMIGLQASIPLEQHTYLILDEAAILDNTDPEAVDRKSSLGIGVVGHRARATLSVAIPEAELRLGYEFKSWFTGDTALYGAAYGIEPTGTVHRVNLQLAWRLL